MIVQSILSSKKLFLPLTDLDIHCNLESLNHIFFLHARHISMIHIHTLTVPVLCLHLSHKFPPPAFTRYRFVIYFCSVEHEVDVD